jgi:hypothetical protein
VDSAFSCSRTREHVSRRFVRARGLMRGEARQDLLGELAHLLIDLADHVVHRADADLLDLACALRRLLEDVESVEDVEREVCDWSVIDLPRRRLGPIRYTAVDAILEASAIPTVVARGRDDRPKFRWPRVHASGCADDDAQPRDWKSLVAMLPRHRPCSGGASQVTR